MPWRSITLPEVLEIEHDLLPRLGSRLSGSFDLTSVAIVTGGPATEFLSGVVADSLAPHAGVVRTISTMTGTIAEAELLLETFERERPTVVLAIGGGQPIDVAKLAASRARIDLVAVPTALSHDGMASPVASLTHADGIRRSLAAAMPAGVIVDLDVVRAAPARFLRAGVGDLVSNLTAVLDWRLAAKSGKADLDEFAASIATHAAETVLDMSWPPTDHDLQTIAQGLVVSGLSMEVAGSSRPCSGAEHLISHALDQHLGDRADLHGRQVAIGSLISSHLHKDHHEALRDLFDRIELFDDILESGISHALVVDAVIAASATRPERYTILDEADLSHENVADVVTRGSQARSPAMTTAVILAAGVGSRLATTAQQPKWLTPLGSAAASTDAGAAVPTPALMQLEGCATSGVVHSVVVVTGYGHDAITETIAGIDCQLPIDTLFNPLYQARNNWFSVLTALESVAGDCVLINSDLCANAQWFSTAIADAAAAATSCLVVDQQRDLTDEAMKVGRDGRGRIDTITKDPIDGAIGEYVGITGVRDTDRAGLVDHLSRFVDDPTMHNNWYEHAIQDHARSGADYRAVDVPSSAWVEVDTFDDLEEARALFGS